MGPEVRVQRPKASRFCNANTTNAEHGKAGAAENLSGFALGDEQWVARSYSRCAAFCSVEPERFRKLPALERVDALRWV
jgi:hypothetical protein